MHELLEKFATVNEDEFESIFFYPGICKGHVPKQILKKLVKAHVCKDL